MKDGIVFSEPDFSGHEIDYLIDCLKSLYVAGDGRYTAMCRSRLENYYGAPVLLTPSCTASLEMAAMLLVGPGDEVVMPSYTFVSTANAFVLRGATPVFIDIRDDTLNVDERLFEEAIGKRTRAIVPVHYGGIGCSMDPIMAIAERAELAVVEDAAQGYLARWNGRPLGSIGTLGAVSFHQSKNVVSGEGGLLVINEQMLLKRAQIIREKGTNRSDFFDGKVDKYEWLDIGSSYLLSDLLAAVLLAQLQAAETITTQRLRIWNQYHTAFCQAEQDGLLRRPVVPAGAEHNGHIYHVRFTDSDCRNAVQKHLLAAGISAYTHYVPLHSSPAGRRYGRTIGPMTVTDSVAQTILRLPIHTKMTESDVDRVIEIVIRTARQSNTSCT
jgi:dTDP-4-amino-4,6-dideoxygalactose transaminase